MEKVTIKRTGQRALQFTGELIAEAISSANNASAVYSGAVGRWQELQLWRTSGGNFVCYRFDGTQWQGEHDREEAVIAKSEEAVIEFFGLDWLAQDLYQAAGIEAVEAVE